MKVGCTTTNMSLVLPWGAEAINLKINLKATGDFMGILIFSLEFEGREDSKG